MPLLLLALLAGSRAAPAADGVVARPVVNLYSKPSLDVDVVSQAILGTSVAILEAQDGWLLIRTPDAYTGWAPATSILTTDRPYAQAGRVVHVVSLFAHLYREPSITRHAPVMTVPFETRLEVVEQAEEAGSGGAQRQRFFEVRLPDGRRAFIQRGDVAEHRSLLSTSEMIALGKRFLGLPYTWGGTSSFGFDCSGFTQMLYRARGWNMPRDAHQQAAWEGVHPVSKESLEPGDLLYFGSSPEKITHTGLYIGGGEFLHATAHERPVVQISRLDEPYWTERLVAQRRLSVPDPPPGKPE